MLVQISSWDQAKAQDEVRRRFEAARKYHREFHTQWRANELALFGPGAAGGMPNALTSYAYDQGGSLDVGNSGISTNYTFRFHRYILGLMSANPPSVIISPTSSDYDDRSAAEVADNLVNYGRRQYNTQEHSDQQATLTLTHGTAWMTVRWTPWAGDLLKVKGNKAVMSGDIKFRARSVWEVMIDPSAQIWDDVRYVFILHLTSREEAMARFPKHRSKIKAYKSAPIGASGLGDGGPQDTDRGEDGRYDVIHLWEYVEKGLPWNGMTGHHVWLLDDGTLIADIADNPNPDASLPIYPLTDVDVPGQVYGKATVDYMIRLQDILNRLDSTVLDNIQAHGVVRMVLFDAEPQESNQPNNGPWQIMTIKTGGVEPKFMDPPALMPDIWRFRQQLMDGLTALEGTNESMYGSVKREMSAYSMQTAISAGNMVRRRLFNKYRNCTEWMYLQYLQLIQLHWPDKRKVLVTGAEGALSVAYYSAADLKHGFDLRAEYGASFSLDPERRREEIMQLLPLLKEAGFNMRQILGMMKLNDVSGLFDMADTARRRQLEIFEEIISKFDVDGVLIYIAPRDLEEHNLMLQAAYEFRMSMAFKVLPDPVQQQIERHIKEREQMAAAPPRPGQVPTGEQPGPAAGGAPPALGGAGGPASQLPPGAPGAAPGVPFLA